jgi:lysophospholipase L1-like esterase
MPDDLQAKVWWVLIGTNDFGARGCSEEVVLMGILRVVEEIRLRRPNDTIVINGILPRTSMPDGRLEGKLSHEQRHFHHLWPSIQVVNKELKRFADKHSDIHYFDASNLFLTQLSNEHYTRDEKIIPTELMSDHHHPTSLGHEIWGKAIVDKVIELSGEDDDDDDDSHEVDTYRQKYHK